MTINDDNFLAEYDLRSLKVRKFGSGRKSFAGKSIAELTDRDQQTTPDP
jgi:hypothetical protein